MPLIVEASSGDDGSQRITFDTDEGPRRDTDLPSLAKLKPAFAAAGIVTAGQLLADVRRRRRDGRDLAASARGSWASPPLARLVAFAVAGVPPEIMGIGPVEAIPQGAETGRASASPTSTSSS